MHLVEDDELVEVSGEECFRVVEACPVAGRLEVEIYAGPRCTNMESKRRLAGLPWPEQRDGWRLVEFLQKSGLDGTLEHAGIQSITMSDLQGSLLPKTSRYQMATAARGGAPIGHTNMKRPLHCGERSGLRERRLRDPPPRCSIEATVEAWTS